MNKKFLLTFLISIFLVCGAAHAEEINETEVFMSQLGVISRYDDGLFHGEYELSRGNFASMLAKVIGMPEDFSGRKIFKDVDAKQSCYNAVTYLYEHEIILGFGDREFRPNECINGEDAAKMLTTALGYAPMAEMQGGNSMAYVNVAKSIGLKSLSAGSMTINDGIKALHSAFTVDLAMKNYDGNKAYYEVKTGKTILNSIYNAEERIGLVTATRTECIYGDTDLEQGWIEIDYERYECCFEDISDYAGYKVKYYVYTDESDKAGELLAIIPQYKEEIIVNADDIESGSVSVLSYNDGKKVVNKKISEDAFYVYNGRNISAPVDEDLNPEIGYIRLIDNDGDSRYDVVFIWSYKNYIVNAALEDKITIKDSKDVINIENVPVRIFKDNTEIDVLDINSDNVISVAQTKDNSSYKLCTILVSSMYLNGKVESYSGGSEAKAVIDGVEYKVYPDISFNNKIGTVIRYYVDVFGKIVAFSESKEGIYGYLYNIYYDEDTEIAKFKILTESGEIKIYDEAKDKITFTEGKMSEKTKTSLLRDKFLYNSSFKPQLIMYSINPEGKLTKLAKAVKTSYAKWDEKQFCLNFEGSNPSSVVCTDNTIYNENNWATEVTNVNYNTKCFFITSKEEDCQVGKLLDMCKSTDTRYPSIKCYDINELGFAGVIVIETTSANDVTMDIKTDYMIITDTSMVSYDDTGAVKISGIGGNGAKEIVCTDLELKNQAYVHNGSIPVMPANTHTAADLRVGDVIQYTVNFNNELTAFRLVYNTTKSSEDFYSGGGLKNDFYYIGEIVRTGDEGFVINMDEEKQRGVIWCNKVKVFKLNNVKNGKSKVTECAKEDIYNGCRVFAFGRSSYNVLCVVIIEQ